MHLVLKFLFLSVLSLLRINSSFNVVNAVISEMQLSNGFVGKFAVLQYDYNKDFIRLSYSKFQNRLSYSKIQKYQKLQFLKLQ